jgi:hypothetical protein
MKIKFDDPVELTIEDIRTYGLAGQTYGLHGRWSAVAFFDLPVIVTEATDREIKLLEDSSVRFFDARKVTE